MIKNHQIYYLATALPILLLVIIALTLLVPNRTIDHNYIEGKVIKVIDGDTIIVLQNDQEYSIRLYGIDTPEKSQWYGQNAKTFTSSQVMGKKVSVEKIDVDRYGRIVGLVSVGNVILNRLLIEYGYAWVYHKYCDRDSCNEWSQIEKQARQNKKGLWKNPNVIPPWQYRHGSKVKTKLDYSGPYHGNINSHIFHAPWCKHFNCKNCTKILQNKASAVNSGYRSCGICKP